MSHELRHVIRLLLKSGIFEVSSGSFLIDWILSRMIMLWVVTGLMLGGRGFELVVGSRSPDGMKESPFLRSYLRRIRGIRNYSLEIELDRLRVC